MRIFARIFKSFGFWIPFICAWGLFFNWAFSDFRRQVIIENKSDQFVTMVLRGAEAECDYYRSDPEAGVCYLFRSGESTEKLTLKPGLYFLKVMPSNGPTMYLPFYVGGKMAVQLEIGAQNRVKETVELRPNGYPKIVITDRGFYSIRIKDVKKSAPKTPIKIIAKNNSEGFFDVVFENEQDPNLKP